MSNKFPITDTISGVERDKLSSSRGLQMLFRIKFFGDKSGNWVSLWKIPMVISFSTELTDEEAEQIANNMSGAITVDDSVKCTKDKTVDGKRFVYVICKDYPNIQEGWIWENQLTNYGKEKKQ